MTTKITTMTVLFAIAAMGILSSATYVVANEQSNNTANAIPAEVEESMNQKIVDLLENRDVLVDENRSKKSHPDMSNEKIDLLNRVAANVNDRFALMNEASQVSEQMKQGNSDGYQDAYLEKIQDKINELQMEARDHVAENKADKVQADPELLATLKEAKQILRESELVVGTFADEKSGSLIIHTAVERQSNEAEIRDRIEQLIDVPYTLMFVEAGDSSCNNQDSDCDPLIGGIAIQSKHSSTTVAPCTISIPAVREVTPTTTEDGFIAAGHCFSTSSSWDDVNQPTHTDPKVGGSYKTSQQRNL